MAALDNDTLAYLTVREGQDTDGRFWEVGVIGHGTRAAGLAEDIAAATGEWARNYGNDAPAPGFRMAAGPARELLTAADPRFIVDKPCSRLVACWP
jgi:protein-L-isoaspartate(D-aspartate) O-methyltransferase